MPFCETTSHLRWSASIQLWVAFRARFPSTFPGIRSKLVELQAARVDVYRLVRFCLECDRLILHARPRAARS